MANKTVMITLQTLLEALKDKVDEAYADRIEKALRMETVDRLEAEALEKLDKIDAVMQLAKQYYPTWTDTDLTLLHFRQETKGEAPNE